MTDIDFLKLKKYIILYRKDYNKEMLKNIIQLHSEYINKFISNHEYDELEKDEVVSILVLSIIDVVNYFDLNKNYDLYKQTLKRTIKKNIWNELKKARFYLKIESYEFYKSQHNNGEDETYYDNLFDNYIKDISKNVIKENLSCLTDLERRIIMLSYGFDCEPKNLKEISEMLLIERSKISLIRINSLLKLNRKCGKKLRYLLDNKDL